MARPVDDEMIQTAENVFREFLRDRGLKYTPERERIVRAVMRNDEHFEAEQLLRDVGQSTPLETGPGERPGTRRVSRATPVGKATVYRTLKLLVECGIVKEVHFSNKQVHYEHTYGQDPHDHMVCRRCRRIIEFDAADVVRLRTVLAAGRHFHALSHRFQIMGLCEACVRSCPVGAVGRGLAAGGAKTSRGRRR
jgi:Fur family transcriptional regulator, ferric uptake regulator